MKLILLPFERARKTKHFTYIKHGLEMNCSVDNVMFVRSRDQAVKKMQDFGTKSVIFSKLRKVHT